MRATIFYRPEGIYLDLEQPDLGHPDGLAIVAKHYRQSTRPRMGFNKDNPAFICEAHVGGTNPGLFIRYASGEWWAAHYESGACKSHRLPAPMSDEHKWQTEYWARAAEDAGWSVDLEHSLPTGTRPDALIFGPVLTGVEVQRSSMTAPAASQRTTRALAAGVTDVWYAGADIEMVMGKLSPRWAHRVPTVGSVRMPWTAVPPRRSATATGLRKFTAIKCTSRNFSLCPETRHQVCGKTHAIQSPWSGMTVDDVAGQFPAGEIVPLRTRRASRAGNVFLVTPADAELYAELTGYRPITPIAPEPRSAPKGRVECANDQTQALLPLYIPPAAVPPRRLGDVPLRARGNRRTVSAACDVCGSPMPDGTCQQQACKLVRAYHERRGG